MKKLNVFKIVMMSLLMLMTISTYAANIQWDGHIDTNGDGTSWNDPFNWVGDVVPGSADNAIFPTAVGTLTVTGTASSPVASLQAWNSVNLFLDLDVTVTSTNATVVKIFDGSSVTVKSGATLTVTVTGTNAGAILFDKPNGTFTVESGGTADLDAWRGITSGANSTSAAVNNYGVMNITATNASIQPNNATAMTIINHPCGIINQLTPTNSGRMKIWSNAAVSTLTNNGLITFAGTTTPVSVSGNNISTNNGFYKVSSGSVLFASGSGTKIENGIDLNSSDTLIDATNTCSVTGMGILAAYDWYADAAGTTMVGSNDTLGLLSFNTNAFGSAGTQTIYTSCYGNDVALTVENVDGNCVNTVSTPDSVDITFLVNTANTTVDAAGLFVGGGAGFGGPTDNPLTDANGDGVWEITIRKPKGFSSDYIFLNGNCPSWTCKEDISGQSCAVAPWNDRNLPTVWNDTILLTCFGSCATDTVCPAPPATVDLTFTVDMSQYGSSFTTAYIFGNFNGWNGTANPLTDQGNGIWTGTITQPENDSIEYKFLADGTAETFAGGETCTKTTGGFTNRFLTFGNMNMAVDTVCWESCMTCPTMPPPAPDSADVTFLVNTANITVDPAGLYLAGGGTFGNPGDNPMSDTNNDGIWEITVRLPEGFTTDYTFTNGNCPSWTCKEDISGQSCAVAPFNDRHFAGAWNDTIVLTCFGSCATDTICPAPPATVDLTFTVDMSQYGGLFTTAYIFGNFNGWNGTANPLTDQGNGIWTGTITQPENDSIEYKFLADGTAETFAGGETCTKTTGGFTNRFLTYGNMNTTIPTVCWESCSACASLTDIQWDGGGDGISWNDGLNWVGDAVPNSSQQAIFPTSAGSLTVSGTASSAVAGIQVWDNAAISLDLDVTVNATTSNTVRLFNGSSLTVKSGRVLDVTLTGVNDGCIIFTQPNGTFNVEGGATANLNGWRGVNSYAIATTAFVNNYGTMNIAASNASIQPNNATAMTIVNHACGTINILSGVMKIWSNAAVSTVTNFGFINNMIGTGGALSVSGNNIAINNAFFASATGSFAAGSGTKIDNGVNANNTIVIDAMNSCSVTNMGILTDYNWYSDSTSMNMVGNNDTLGALTFNTNAFATAGTQTIYTCYDADVVFEVQNLSGPCVNSSTAIDTVDLTFTVDMSQYGSFTTAFIFGNFNSWNGTANPLTDQGNGIWSGTISVPENDSIEYKFLADGMEETFAGGETCTKTSFGFTNRFLTFGTMDMTLDTVCWNSCSACLPTPDSVMVTFKVDMSLENPISSDGVFVVGSFSNWSNIAMSDIDNDSIYEASIMVAEAMMYEFKFKNGTNGLENMDTSFDASCVLPSTDNNRMINVGTTDMTLMANCFETCVSCDIVSSTNSIATTAAFNMMPNPANNYLLLLFGSEYYANEKTVTLHNTMGQTVFSTVVNNTNEYRFSTANYPSGMYFITVQTAEGKLTKRLMVNH